MASALAPAAEPTAGGSSSATLQIAGEAASSVPASRPPNAGALDVQIVIGDVVQVVRGTAILARPAQALRLGLALDAGGAPRSTRVVPPMTNAPDGRGPGGAQLRQERQVAWSWTAGTALDLDENSLLWRTPSQGGYYELRCRVLQDQAFGSPEGGLSRGNPAWGEATLAVLVGEEFDARNLMLQGVAIGVYPDPAAEDAPIRVQENTHLYRAPRYLFKVTPETAQLAVSPNFRLGDFAMDFERFGDRQFIAIDPKLIERLELITQELRRSHPRARLTVVRGYVSPIAADALRRDGANISTYSRFLYGDAAVILVDVDGDGRMDDLNGDGTIDGLDARYLADICEQVEARTGAGGIGVYARPPDASLPDTPFVHVDTRGIYARWELLDRDATTTSSATEEAEAPGAATAP